MKFRLVLLFVSFCVFSFSNYSNGQATVSGKIIDAQNQNEAVPFAAVLLKNNTDTTKLFNTQSDENGFFQLKSIPNGFYRIMVRSVGYKPYISRISVVAPVTNLGEIKLGVSSVQLKDVEVVTEKPFIQMQGDRQVINVEKNMLTTGGTAQDVLKKLPSISVDMDGNVSYRGNSSVQIWIDGKPSVGGSSLAQLLQQIPASNISKVEMISNPSAKYDAESTGGIINIVTKTPEGKALGGYIDASWLVYNKANIGGGIQAKKGKWAYQLNYSFRYDPRGQYGDGSRKSTFNDIFSEAKYSSGEVRTRMSHSIRGGLEYNPSTTSKWSLSFSATPNQNNQFEFQKTVQTGAAGDTNLIINRQTKSIENSVFSNGSLGWRKTFPSQFKLASDLQYSGSFRKDKNDYTTNTPIGNYFGSALERNLTKGYEQNLIYNLDFTKEMTQQKTVEFGVRSAARFTAGENMYNKYDDASADYTIDSSRSNAYKYTQEVAAGYFTFRQSIKKFNYAFGLRAEYTVVRGSELTRNISVAQNYFNLFPSGSITYNISKTQQLNASYSLRINRPNMRQLLPVGDYSDVQNIRKGNIDLIPEIIHSVEGNYNITFLKQYIQAGVYYKHILHSIAWKRQFINDQTSLNTFVNADATKNLGIELVMKNVFFKIWEITSSYNAGYIDVAQTQGSSKIRNTGWRHTLKAMSVVNFWKGTTFQVGYEYYSPNVTLQGTFNGYMTLDAGIKKQFLDKRLTLGFNVNDILNSQRFYGTASGDGFEQSFLRKRETRTYTLSLNYRFGMQEKKSRRDRPGMDDSGGGDMDF